MYDDWDWAVPQSEDSSPRHKGGIIDLDNLPCCVGKDCPHYGPCMGIDWIDKKKCLAWIKWKPSLNLTAKDGDKSA